MLEQAPALGTVEGGAGDVVDDAERHSAKAVAAGNRLADVAARFGYSDQSHFTRDFARLVGTTPRSYGPPTGGAVPIDA